MSCNIVVKDKQDTFWLCNYTDGDIAEDLSSEVKKLIEQTSESQLFAEVLVNILVKDSSHNYEIVNGEHSGVDCIYTVDLENKELYYREIRRVGLDYEQGCKVYLIGG